MDSTAAPDSEIKSKSKSVSLPPDMWERVEATATKRYGGNRSAYLRELVERDERGESQRTTAISPTILQDLAAIYLPTRAAQLTDELVRPAKADPANTINQPVVLENVLAAILRALRDPAFEPEMPFELADKARIEKWEAISDARLGALAAKLAASLGKPLPFVAEPQATYGKADKPPGRRSSPPPPPPAANAG
jgi:Arc/MetJ-type ribon-helix-helix transcriptional regulator